MSATHTNRRRRFGSLRFALAGVAVLGIGAAITTAAWTDDVYFGAQGVASSFDLQGTALGAAADCSTATGWQDIGVPGETDETTTIDFSTAEFGALAPGEVVTAELCLRNVGTADGTIDDTVSLSVSGPLYDGGYLIEDDIEVALDDTALPAGAVVGGEVTITTFPDWDDGAFGLAADIVIVFTASSD
jgi:hypothetical protein